MNFYNNKKWLYIIVFAIFVIYSLTLILPFVWLINNSFKTAEDFFFNVWGVPKRFFGTNYADGFTVTVNGYNLFGMILNSVFVCVVGVLVSMFFNLCASYIFARFNFFGRKLIYALAITLMIVPTVGSTSALYLFMMKTNLYDTYLGLFVLQANPFTFNFLLLYACFIGISKSYEEAAEIEGASAWTIFVRIMIPQAAPVLLSLSIIQFIGIWNDFYTPYMFLPSKLTLAVGLDILNSKMTYDNNYPMLFAIMVISVIPVLILFVLFQRTIMENTVAGGLKG